MEAIAVPKRKIGDSLEIASVVNGLWQVAGGHGKVTAADAQKHMKELIDLGLTTFDGADIYGPAEDYMGEVNVQQAEKKAQFMTKFVPRPGSMTREAVEGAINKSMRRMKTDKLDLVQFHWWDYEDEEYLNALKYLFEMKNEGKIREVGLTNFDTERMRIMYKNGHKIVSNQVSYSIIDRRPEKQMIEFCKQHNVKLLAYGTVLGGLLSEKYLGVPEPSPSDLTTTSLRKYLPFIKQWGDWDTHFQPLLRAMKSIADKYNVSIANVACQYILQKPCVGAVIIGIRPGHSNHIQDNLKIFSFQLSAEDVETLDSLSNKGRQLDGDCGDEYR
jgi:aryl-alcohol dehydrogenase-like predicted oxidoreductase